MKDFGLFQVWTVKFNVTRWVQPARMGYHPSAFDYRHGFCVRVARRRVVGVTW